MPGILIKNILHRELVTKGLENQMAEERTIRQCRDLQQKEANHPVPQCRASINDQVVLFN